MVNPEDFIGKRCKVRVGDRSIRVVVALYNDHSKEYTAYDEAGNLYKMPEELVIHFVKSKEETETPPTEPSPRKGKRRLKLVEESPPRPLPEPPNTRELKESRDYWKRRCQLAEGVIEDAQLTEVPDSYNEWYWFKTDKESV